jgi:hypothetical protein
VFIGNKNSFKLWACLHACIRLSPGIANKTLQDRSFLAFLLACYWFVCRLPS